MKRSITHDTTKEAGFGKDSARGFAQRSPIWARFPRKHQWRLVVGRATYNHLMHPELTAIDLYAGIGGWALGLQMAGIEVVESFEWWDDAARTHSANLHGTVTVADIRGLPLEKFPKGVDFVVGSPPCTQFSYANRGGHGDIEDGMRDIQKFLEVVRHVKPRFWAMENVPRVAGILRRELAPGGALEAFTDLVTVIEVVDTSDWGVPQRRQRMVAGNFNVDLLNAYRDRWSAPTMGEVLDILQEGKQDPIYRVPVPVLTDNVLESSLSGGGAHEQRCQNLPQDL